MTNLTCDNCGRAFIPRQADARFCSRDCNIAWHAEERREALRQYREQGSTYFDRAQNNQELGGRFAPYVTGSGGPSPLPAPSYAADVESSGDRLGFAIDEVEQG